jgi:hypothetical protein
MTGTVTEELQEQVLTAVRKGQDKTLGAIKTVVDAASRVTHKIPAVSLPFETRLPFDGKLPFEGKLPKPERIVSGAYDFAEKLLADQRKFADDVLKATAALRPAAKPDAATAGATAEGATAESATAGGAATGGAATGSGATNEATEDGTANGVAKDYPAREYPAGE